MSLLPLSAMAGGHQVCGNQVVPDSVRHCPNGGMPVFIADSIEPIAPSRAADQPRRPLNDPALSNSSALSYYYGVWRTSIPGAVWTSPSGYQGQDWLHVSAGAAAGDLIIKPNGTYVWASYGGKAGQWVRGDAEYPIILIDTVENRRWKVGADRNHNGGRDIMVWDGKFYNYNGRR